jgi:3-hydroxyacyl-CoA dehydrogenase/enoyl-CoA hydratase/3-hydroxybutyryl-CoA epimerase
VSGLDAPVTRIRWERDDDGVVVLTLDDPNQGANTMSPGFREDLTATVQRLEAERDQITGVILTSAKKSFFAGGDLKDMRTASPDDSPAIVERGRHLKRQLRTLETLGKPLVAAINGAALGGGLELCLACHHRIALSDPKVQLGLPEVTLGLLPGAGGVTRSVRMLGLLGALNGLLLKGQRMGPEAALELGIVDELVDRREDLIPAAKAWIKEHPDAVQPWDQKGYKVPGGTPPSPELAQLPILQTQLKKVRSTHQPAPHYIMAAAVEGAKVDFDSASEIETRYFATLITGQVAKNMMQAFFFDMQRVTGARDRPASIETFRPSKAVVLGAGMMGAGIAYVCARAGIEVVLKDVTLEAAERGRAYSEKVVGRAVEKGRSTREAGDALLGRITPTVDAADAAGADLVIEAVFEDPDLKRQTFAEIEPHLAPDALLASNTSTLPITDLAGGVTRPEAFIGMHFFSPVDRMPLLEIIKGGQTSQETLFRALDVARLLRKTPIVVNDSRGFFTSRVIGTFAREGVSMLADGIPPASIERATLQAGYPVPLLQLMDELNMELSVKIRKAAEAAGVNMDHPANAVTDRMIELGRPGRLRGAGFYDYADGRRTGLWPGLREEFPPLADPTSIDLVELEERLLFIEAIESVKCLQEGVIESVADANVGSITGIGYPGWTGGVLQYINGYEDSSGRRRGPAGFVERARELAAAHGARFEPPALLVEKAERGETFTDE